MEVQVIFRGGEEITEGRSDMLGYFWRGYLIEDIAHMIRANIISLAKS